MNTTAIYSSEHSWSRRCSTETILSIQGQETDIVRDTSDTEPFSEGDEYEPVTEPEDDAPIHEDTSNESDNEIISTRVLEVRVGDEGDLVFADSERATDSASDSDRDLFDYWLCAQCRADNDDPTYRYCRKCFQVRKKFFPPRPRRKHKRGKLNEPGQPYKRDRGIDPDTNPVKEAPRALSQDSGVEFSQGTSQDTENVRLPRGQKRRADSVDTNAKRCKFSDASDSESEPVTPPSKTLSDPSITVEKSLTITKKVVADTLKEIETKDLCVVCVSEPKSGVFVHGRLAHICCCYKCAVKVWAKTKRCPVCNCKISNVLRAVVM